MSLDLGEWQERLARHFAGLRNRRCTRRIATPMFGLEHGLTPPEVQALEAAVRSDIARRRPSPDHWLAWIVYSSELGYRYSGDEYWQTFEHETPGWTDNGKPLPGSRFLPALPAGVWGRSPIRTLGRVFLDHMLAHHTRDPPQGFAITTRAHTL